MRKKEIETYEGYGGYEEREYTPLEEMNEILRKEEEYKAFKEVERELKETLK